VQQFQHFLFHHVRLGLCHDGVYARGARDAGSGHQQQCERRG